jgi:hypothetical protein
MNRADNALLKISFACRSDVMKPQLDNIRKIFRKKIDETALS